MRASYTKLHLHLVWATWDRLLLIDPAPEEELRRILGAKARELGCQALASGGDFDHIHCLLRFTPTVSIADVVGGLKGASSHRVNSQWRPSYTFKWQGSYGALSVSEEMLPDVEAYVRRQRQHHASRELREDWERCLLPDPPDVPGG